jgi:predicted RNA-binding protein (virulence factor B family)
MAELGKRNSLRVLHSAPPGIYLDGGELGEILLPHKYVPRGTGLDDFLDVFVYRDSEDRLVATTETPLAMVGEFALLEVVSVNRQVGAFLNWGLPKDLLLPFGSRGTRCGRVRRCWCM